MSKEKVKAIMGRDYSKNKTPEELIGPIGFGEPVIVDPNKEVKVLITGEGSYIGENFKKYANEKYPSLKIDTINMIGDEWKNHDFSGYDIVYHVAGIAHADVGKVDDEIKEMYYKVNTDLALETCQKAKKDGVKEFIFMSSMIIYGEYSKYGKECVIDEKTVPEAANFYGDSKLQADVAVRDEADDHFKVIVLRPPMIYGKNSKGNYPSLSKLAKKMRFFPKVKNERSMLYIENLCEFLCQVMLIKEIKRNEVVLIPQNKEWTNTTEMAREIAIASGKKSRPTGGLLKFAVKIGSKMPGKIGGLINKAFGNSCYAHELSAYPGLDYIVYSLSESIKRTEG